MKRTEHGRGRAFKVAVGAIGWAAVWGVASSSGCASIVGADDYKVGDGGGAGAGGGGGGPACGATWTGDDPTCEACMERLCCTQLQACGPGMPCAALFVCGQRNCPAFALACLQSLCAAELAASQSSLIALGTCHSTQCCSGQCADCTN